MHVKYFNVLHIILFNIWVKTCRPYVNDALLCSLLFNSMSTKQHTKQDSTDKHTSDGDKQWQYF